MLNYTSFGEARKHPAKAMVCPYCFNHFSSDNVLFRAPLNFYGSNFDATSTQYLSYFDYSEPVSGGKIISTPASWDDCSFAVFADKVGSYRVLVSCTDEFGSVLSNRICPHCHGSLPRNYGINETMLVGVLGASEEDNALYEWALFDTLINNAASIGFSLNDDEIEYHHNSRSGGKLPQYDNPIIGEIDIPGGRTGVTEVFLTVWDKLLFEEVDNKFALMRKNYLSNLDAYLFVINPAALPQLTDYISIIKHNLSSIADTDAIIEKLNTVSSDDESKSELVEYMYKIKDVMFASSANVKPVSLVFTEKTIMNSVFAFKQAIPVIAQLNIENPFMPYSSYNSKARINDLLLQFFIQADSEAFAHLNACFSKKQMFSVTRGGGSVENDRALFSASSEEIFAPLRWIIESRK